jgi:hypothetical protein
MYYKIKGLYTCKPRSNSQNKTHTGAVGFTLFALVGDNTICVWKIEKAVGACDYEYCILFFKGIHELLASVPLLRGVRGVSFSSRYLCVLA